MTISVVRGVSANPAESLEERGGSIVRKLIDGNQVVFSQSTSSNSSVVTIVLMAAKPLAFFDIGYAY